MPFSFGESPIFAGQSIQVFCSVTEGDLPLKITWIFEKSSKLDELGIITSLIGKKTSMLSIDSVGSEHTGKYTCIAENRAGLVEFSDNLIINGKFKLYINYPRLMVASNIFSLFVFLFIFCFCIMTNFVSLIFVLFYFSPV